MKIGVLALQGDFAEHIQLLKRTGVEAVEVRLPEQLDSLSGLIIPGGESTTIGKLAVAYRLIEPLQQFGQEKAIWGTCAGAIFMANDIHRDQPLLGLMDITVERNAFGRQLQSFETGLDIVDLKGISEDSLPFPAIFIRAPIIKKVFGRARVWASLPDGRIVGARQGKLLATSFHPELTGDDRLHRFFVQLAGNGTARE
jgi:pyridoxal 5'-phosphate synthase pdxT subunit